MSEESLRRELTTYLDTGHPWPPEARKRELAEEVRRRGHLYDAWRGNRLLRSGVDIMSAIVAAMRYHRGRVELHVPTSPPSP